ncbi:MAG: hypothetical protein J0L75_03475 [Spirochaetes bacterium]|nr:hypothetical protein [Spirochaetota bacterium]
MSARPTRRENLLRVLRGEEPAWVPFSPNFKQWFDHHERLQTLPKELAGADYLGAMKALGCDVFSRNLGAGLEFRDTVARPKTEVEETPLGERRVTHVETPHGCLSSVYREQRAQSTGHVDEYPVKDWDRDGKAALWRLDQREFRFDAAAFEALDERVGEDGLVNVTAGCSPLKQLHHEFGMEAACYFLTDDPEAAQTYCDAFWGKLHPAIRALAEHPRVVSVILMDNVDTPFYAPGILERFWLPYVREAADLLRQKGKYLWVHACGQLRQLGPFFAQAGVTGLEGVSHPPLGDWWVDEAQACAPNFVFNGGFSAAEQEMPSEEALTAFYRGFFARASRRRMILSTSCQTNIRTPWERLKRVRDLTREWGGRPLA